MTMVHSGGRTSRWVQNAVILIAVGVFATATLSGNNESRKVRQTLEYNAVRGDCIRDVQGESQQQLYIDLSDILNVGRDPAKFDAIRKRMAKAAKVNPADIVLAHCPPAIKGAPKPTTTIATTTTTTSADPSTSSTTTTTRSP